MIFLKISKKPYTVKDVKKDNLKKIFEKVKQWSIDIQKHQKKSEVYKEINQEIISLKITSSVSVNNEYFYLEEDIRNNILYYLNQASNMVLDNPYGTITGVLDPMYVYLENEITNRG